MPENIILESYGGQTPWLAHTLLGRIIVLSIQNDLPQFHLNTWTQLLSKSKKKTKNPNPEKTQNSPERNATSLLVDALPFSHVQFSRRPFRTALTSIVDDHLHCVKRFKPETFHESLSSKLCCKSSNYNWPQTLITSHSKLTNIHQLLGNSR